ncbi:MAG: CaiB/BaiF CoA-transferase family protein [Bacteroidia bacterium]|nr:CaiB/BaiF CoA-transferase family protein [Bacteroidia bacterium]
MDQLFSGIRVIELANVLAGPSVGMFFAELGAELIKVENVRTHGDVTRSWRLPTETKEGDISAYFTSINWGKKSIALDLKKEEGREIVYRLVKNADMVISSYLPGKDKKLGVDPESLLQVKKDLIVGEISGYGPEIQKAAFDAIIQAEAGFIYMNGEKQQTYKMPVALMDVMAGHQLKQGMLLAYIHKLKTGKGSIVHSSLLKSGISALVNQASNYLNIGHMPEPIGSEHPNIVPYGTQYACNDGSKIILAIGNDVQFKRLCNHCLGVAVPESFQRNEQRVAQRAGVHKFLSHLISQKSPITLLEKISEHKIPASRVRNMKEVFEDQLTEDVLLRGEHFKGVKSMISEGSFLPSDINLSEPPNLSEHAQEILKDLNYSDQKITELANQQVILLP